MSDTSTADNKVDVVVNTTKKKRGFAVIDPAKHREICSKGGKASHMKGTAHRFTSEEAMVAGRKGGIAAAAKGREYMRALGRKGGNATRSKAMEEAEAKDLNLEPALIY